MNRKRGYLTVLMFLMILLAAGCKEEKKEGNIDASWNLLSATQVKDGLEIKIAGQNLLGDEKVKLEADSEESESHTVEALRDGITENKSVRWSSDNDWEDNDHWVTISFPEPTEVGALRLYWERTNAKKYFIEVSEDGSSWKSVYESKEPPREKTETILLKEAKTTNYLRLHVTEVEKKEEDGSLYYQNISLLEMEVYGRLTDSFVLKTPVVKAQTNRQLELPTVPEGYTVSFLGARHDALINEQGNIADTIGAAKTEIGFSLQKNEKTVELPAMEITIPPSDKKEAFLSGIHHLKGEDDIGKKGELPESMIPMEWCPAGGEIIIEEFDKLKIETTLLSKEEAILGEEGFQITIGKDSDDTILIEGKTKAAIGWGKAYLKELWVENENTLPKGILRDYPAYKVRGFGMDVGRKAVSMDLLYKIVDKMSEKRMNTLLVHLNDNQILSQNNQPETLEDARSLYAGFRLESQIQNENGVGITSTDLYYTKEEFRQFIDYADSLGVEVVPEIDTPGHSLSLIKTFPHLGIQDVEAADLLDVSKEETRQLVKNIWKEYLVTEEEKEATFENCETIHIGMDEYFGEEEAYIEYLQEMVTYLKEIAPEKTIRMWGSLTGMGCDYTDLPRDIQIQLWSTQWADPTEMYEAGFSIINSQNNQLYIVPKSGYDWLDVESLEKNWKPNVFWSEERTWEIPSYSPKMLGACYMLWNDMDFLEEVEITEEDLYQRFEQPLGVISDKLWQ